MKDQERFKQLLAETASEVVPDEMDLWPAVRDQISTRPVITRRMIGVLPLMAVLVIVALAALLVFRPDNNSAMIKMRDSLCRMLHQPQARLRFRRCRRPALRSRRSCRYPPPR